MALTVIRGQVVSVASATNAGALSLTANTSEDATSKGYNVLTGQEVSVAAAITAGALSLAANVKVN